MVLLLVFDEGISDLLDVSDSAFLLYLLETLPNRSHCLPVVLDDPHPLFVLADEDSQSIADEWLGICCLVLLVHFALSLKEVIFAFTAP